MVENIDPSATGSSIGIFITESDPWREDKTQDRFSIQQNKIPYPKPKARKHNRFIKELKAIAKKANTTPMEYFKNTFLPYLDSKCSKQNLAYAKKELGFCVVKEDDATHISEQLKKAIKSLPKKEQKRLESLKNKNF